MKVLIFKDSIAVDYSSYEEFVQKCYLVKDDFSEADLNVYRASYVQLIQNLKVEAKKNPSNCKSNGHLLTRISRSIEKENTFYKYLTDNGFQEIQFMEQ